MDSFPRFRLLPTKGLGAMHARTSLGICDIPVHACIFGTGPCRYHFLFLDLEMQAKAGIEPFFPVSYSEER